MSNLTLMTTIGFILFLSRGITGPVSSLYTESLGASYVTIGILGTVSSLTLILCSFLWGRASDRLSQRKVFLVLGLATLAVSAGLQAVAPSYEVLFPLHILGAVAGAAYGTASLALMGDLLEQRHGERGRRMGVYRGLGSLGFGLTAFLSGSIADWLSLRATFGLAAAFVALAFLLALNVKECSSSERLDSTAGHDASAGQPFRVDAASTVQAAKPKPLTLMPLLISAFLWSLVTGAVYSVWANYMVGELSFTQAQMSRLWALASLSEFPFMILAGWLSDRIGRVQMLSLGFLAWTFVFLGYVFTPLMPWIALIQLLRGFAYSAFTATAMTYAAEVRAKAQRGRVSGLYSSAGGLGTVLGSSMGGALAQFAGFQSMIGINAALIFGGAVYLAAVAVHRTARARSQAEASGS
jgi:MFS family permease